MTYLWQGIHHHLLKVLKVCVCLNKALKSTVWQLPNHTGFLCKCMRWTRWKWQAATSSSPSLQTAPSTTEPAFLLQQSQHSGGRCGRVFKSSEAFCSLYESDNLTAVLFQTNNIKDNQIKRSCRLPPPANGDLCGWTWESYRDKQWHSLIDRDRWRIKIGSPLSLNLSFTPNCLSPLMSGQEYTEGYIWIRWWIH